MKEERYYDDEIDLYELWLTLKRRKWVLLFTIFFFTLASAVYAFLSPPVYQLRHYFSEPISEFVPYQVRSAVEVINSYLKEGDYSRLSRLLGMEERKVRSITSVEVPRVRKSGGVFSLVEEGKDLKVLGEFDSKLVSYLESLPSIGRLVEERRRLLKSQLETYLKRIKEMERLASVVRGQIERGELKVVGFNPVELDTVIADYRAKVDELKAELSTLSPFKEVSLYSSDRPVKPKKALIISVGAVSGLFFGTFLAFFLEWLDGVRRREKG